MNRPIVRVVVVQCGLWAALFYAHLFTWPDRVHATAKVWSWTRREPLQDAMPSTR